jgi:hypothetical protein
MGANKRRIICLVGVQGPQAAEGTRSQIENGSNLAMPQPQCRRIASCQACREDAKNLTSFSDSLRIF